MVDGLSYIMEKTGGVQRINAKLACHDTRQEGDFHRVVENT